MILANPAGTARLPSVIRVAMFADCCPRVDLSIGNNPSVVADNGAALTRDAFDDLVGEPKPAAEETRDEGREPTSAGGGVCQSSESMFWRTTPGAFDGSAA